MDVYHVHSFSSNQFRMIMVGKILFQLNVYIYIPWKYQGYQSLILSMVGCNFAEGLSDAFAAQLSFKVVFLGHQGHSKNCGRLVVSVDNLSLSLFCFLSWIPHQWTYLDQSSAWLFQPFISCCWSVFFRSIVSLQIGTNGSNFVTGSNSE